MRSLPRLLALTPVLLLAAACASVSGARGTVETVAIPANAAFDSAYRSGDADAVAALLTEDAIISSEGIPDVVGRTVIRDVLARLFESSHVAAFTLQPLELEVSGAIAYERGTFIFSSGPKDGTQSARTGRYTLLRRRGSDGRWLVHRYMENCLPSPCQ